MFVRFRAVKSRFLGHLPEPEIGFHTKAFVECAGKGMVFESETHVVVIEQIRFVVSAAVGRGKKPFYAAANAQTFSTLGRNVKKRGKCEALVSAKTTTIVYGFLVGKRTVKESVAVAKRHIGINGYFKILGIGTELQVKQCADSQKCLFHFRAVS